MAKKRIYSQADIPDLIEEILPLYSDAIDKLQAKEELTPAEIHLAMKLAKSLTETYAIYRIMKAETKKEFQTLNLDKLSSFVATLNPKN